MPLIPSTTLLYAHSLSLLTISYFLLISPLPLLTSAPLLILGEAMHIRPASFQPSPSRLSKGLTTLSSQSTELLGILGVVLVGYAVTEMLFASGLSTPSNLQSSSDGKRRDRSRMGEELYALTATQSSHLNLAFVHIMAGGTLCSWIYVFHSARAESLFSKPARGMGGLGGVLGNQVVFSVALIDMLFWGYLWTVIREERREVLSRVQQLVEDRDED